jgi:hypothetical protein
VEPKLYTAPTSPALGFLEARGDPDIGAVAASGRARLMMAGRTRDAVLRVLGPAAGDVARELGSFYTGRVMARIAASNIEAD